MIQATAPFLDDCCRCVVGLGMSANGRGVVRCGFFELISSLDIASGDEL